jgi:hypothetical protein
LARNSLEEIEVPFPKIRLLIDATTAASEADLEKVKADASLLPDFQGPSQFGHGARRGLESDASLKRGRPDRLP